MYQYVAGNNEMRGEFPNLSQSDFVAFFRIKQDKENIRPGAYKKIEPNSKYWIYSSMESKLYIITKSDAGTIQSWCECE
jgi:hypothetical protein